MGGAGKAAPPPPKNAGKGGAGKAKPEPFVPKGAPAAKAGVGGMAALLARVKDKGEAMDKEHGMNIDDVDLTKIDKDAKGETFKCPRCQLEILVSMAESHANSHSAEILPWLYLGAARNADNGKELTVRTGITHILNVAHEVNQDRDAKKEWEEYNAENNRPCEYKKFSWTDTADQDILKEMAGPIEFLHDAHEKDVNNHILVHCVQGISRSASVVLYYLMKYEKMSLKNAFDHVHKLRTVVEPRSEFLRQLGAYECKAFGLDKPTLTPEDVYADKTLLNVDDPIVPLAAVDPARAPGNDQVSTAQSGVAGATCSRVDFGAISSSLSLACVDKVPKENVQPAVYSKDGSWEDGSSELCEPLKGEKPLVLLIAYGAGQQICGKSDKYVSCRDLLEAAGFRVECPMPPQSEWHDYQREPSIEYDPSEDSKNLAAFIDKFVGPRIRDDPRFRPVVTMCASKGGLVCIHHLWRRYWRGPTLVINGTCVEDHYAYCKTLPALPLCLPRAMPLCITSGEHDMRGTPLDSVANASKIFECEFMRSVMQYHSATDGHCPASFRAVIVPLVSLLYQGFPSNDGEAAKALQFWLPPGGKLRFKAPQLHTDEEASAERPGEVAEACRLEREGLAPGEGKASLEEIRSALQALHAWLSKHPEVLVAGEVAASLLSSVDVQKSSVLRCCGVLRTVAWEAISASMSAWYPKYKQDREGRGRFKALYFCCALMAACIEQLQQPQDGSLNLAWVKLIRKLSEPEVEESVPQQAVPTSATGGRKGEPPKPPEGGKGGPPALPEGKATNAGGKGGKCMPPPMHGKGSK
eukprot:TRINITY_DN11309_c0_g2_i1.p1 TRINITY_DN11309_c0_g2~~TRINITY_DN11309_c0_g2_i1.p1  ORF type:complete len:810 (+),score=96.62 TRINITY_DN11309_c0_g2_i1:86-2515(+)